VKAIKRLACALPLMGVATTAIGGEWASWPTPKDNIWVGAGFKLDDGGALIITCDQAKKHISYTLDEPRAHWQTGAKIAVLVLADDGKQTQLSTGVVINPTQLVVWEESTRDLNTIGHAKSFFGIGAGGYGRIFPVTNLREATAPVLTACGDHWATQ
jgi:hypothetical protein